MTTEAVGEFVGMVFSPYIPLVAGVVMAITLVILIIIAIRILVSEAIV